MTYYGQAAIDKYLHENYFPNTKSGFFVECGAADGVSECTCKFFEESLGWSGINIEPAKPSYEKLMKNRPNSYNYNVALYNENIVKKFVHLIKKENPDFTYGLGKIFNENEKYVDNEIWKYSIFDIQCMKFSDIFNFNMKFSDISGVIDLFVLDVEGSEIEALQGILEIDKEFYPRIFCIEATQIDVEKLNSMLCKYYTISERRNQDIIYKKL